MVIIVAAKLIWITTAIIVMFSVRKGVNVMLIEKNNNISMSSSYDFNLQENKKDNSVKDSENSRLSNKTIFYHSNKENSSASASEGASFVSLSLSLKQLNVLSATRKRLDGQSGVLSSEIKLDAARGQDVSEKKEKLSDINSMVEKLNKQMKEALEDLNDEIDKINKEKDKDKNKTDKVDKDKIDKNKKDKINQTGEADKADMAEKVKEEQTEKTPDKYYESKSIKEIDIYV